MNKQSRSSRTAAYQELRTRILTLALTPGQRLNDVALAAELGMSRTPIREALYELAHEDLVTLGERGGFVVKELAVHDIQAAFEAIHLISRAVARKVALHAEPAELDALAKLADEVHGAMKSADPGAIAELNSQFHIFEATISGNKYFLATVKRLQTVLQRLAYSSFGGTRVTEEPLGDHHALSDAQHRELINHYRAGNADAAEALAAEHVELFQRRVEAFFTRNDTKEIRL